MKIKTEYRKIKIFIYRTEDKIDFLLNLSVVVKLN